MSVDTTATSPTTPFDKARLDRTVTAHLGHYNAAVAWAIEHGQVGVGHIADLIASRDSSAMVHMTGQRGFECDRAEWAPKLDRAVLAMIEDFQQTNAVAVTT